VEVRIEVEPAWPVRLPGGGVDGVLRRRGSVLERLLHIEGDPVVVRVAQTAGDRVLFGAWAPSRAQARAGIERMRFALGVDDDLRDFHDRFAADPVIGRSVRRTPWLRVRRRPEPFEALEWAITEQLIELTRAAAIQRRMVARWGRRDRASGLRDAPSAAAVADLAPAELQACDLSAGRAAAMVRCAREVASGRADLSSADHERAWRRLRKIPGIGSWTVDMLALYGKGRYDVIPAGDLGFLKTVGRALSGGDPKAYATEDDVRSFFARYEPWAGLAGLHFLLG
jgi:DNA-3-methyladenine glycosylase II